MTIGAAQQFFLGASKATGGGGAGYQIERSLRFNSSDSGFCSRTPAVAGNRKTWTWAGWVKRSYVGATYKMLFSADNGAHSCGFRFTNSPSDTIEFFEYNGGFTWQLVTTQVFRDLSAWYHIVVVFDSTQGTSTNRLKLYVNGTQVTAFGTASYPSPNYDSLINAAVAHNIGAYAGIQNFDGYLADIHFIDGQALTPSSFTEVSATTGQLIPKAYTGSFGTNGFWLKFSDNSAATATTLGKDYSGNSNNWTPNNLSVTAGAGNDSLVDTPTSFGSDTGAGGEVRGNYCTGNPIHPNLDAAPVTLSNGNLDGSITSSSNWYTGQCTLAVTTGKWYFEQTINSGYAAVGIAAVTANFAAASDSVGSVANSVGYIFNGNKQLNGPASSYGSSIGSGDVIGCAFDMDAQTVTFYKNGASQGVITSAITTGVAYAPCFSLNGQNGTGSYSWNFGQRQWAYAAPAGFKALCDTNLPAPVVAKPNTVMDAILYSGNSSTQSITSLEFSPDLVWSKCRNVGRSHRLSDAVRGSNRDLYSDVTYSEAADGSITAFTANGFNLDNSTGSQYNTSGETYVSWCWDAGSSTVSNTAGSITSQVRANASAGFSIVTWNGNGNATIGHGLGVAPQFIICKKRTGTGDWQVGHYSLGWTKRLGLNLTTAEETTISAWNNTAPTSTVFSVGNTSNFGGDIVSYCFAPVVGYSSFGSYTGNGSADGPFVFCGFRPRWILTKRYDGGVNGWGMFDALRPGYNLTDSFLQAQSSGSESTGASAYSIDILSNGFKVRGTDAFVNQSGGSYIFAAFAESPFQYSRAR